MEKPAGLGGNLFGLERGGTGDGAGGERGGDGDGERVLHGIGLISSGGTPAGRRKVTGGGFSRKVPEGARVGGSAGFAAILAEVGLRTLPNSVLEI